MVNLRLCRYYRKKAEKGTCETNRTAMQKLPHQILFYCGEWSECIRHSQNHLLIWFLDMQTRYRLSKVVMVDGINVRGQVSDYRIFS
jgi:hypothetical protein